MMHTADSYRSEWATLTGRSEREVYVPVALRGPETGERAQVGTMLGLIGEVSGGRASIAWADGGTSSELVSSMDWFAGAWVIR